MWGRGQEGQLGVGTHQDSSHPRAVELLQGRKVLQVGRWWHSCKGLQECKSPADEVPHSCWGAIGDSKGGLPAVSQQALSQN